MPYKDPEKSKANKRRYYLENRDKFISLAVEREKELDKTPFGKFLKQKKKAKKRGIEWRLAFEDWCEIWQDSGHWAERGRGSNKYCMCRRGDVGPYSIDNVYIDTVFVNNSHQIYNDKGPYHTRSNYIKVADRL